MPPVNPPYLLVVHPYRRPAGEPRDLARLQREESVSAFFLERGQLYETVRFDADGIPDADGGGACDVGRGANDAFIHAAAAALQAVNDEYAS